jgi:hypothetical protein
MTTAAELREDASAFLGTDVQAAGIFAADVSIAVRAAGGAAAATAADAVGVGDSPMADGVAAAAGMRMAQEAGAAAQGLTGVMLVAVTADAVVLMDWNGNSAAGAGPTKVLASFNRAQTTVSATKLGATHKVTLTGPEREATISAGLGLLSSGKEGKRDVLKALDCD